MKINVTGNIKNYDGSDTDLTFRDCIIQSLNSVVESDSNVSLDDKTNMYKISLRVAADDEVDLSVDERALIKTRVNKFFSPLVVGRVSDLFEDGQSTGEEHNN